MNKTDNVLLVIQHLNKKKTITETELKKLLKLSRAQCYKTISSLTTPNNKRMEVLTVIKNGKRKKYTLSKHFTQKTTTENNNISDNQEVILKQLLKKHDGKVSNLAKATGVTPVTIYKGLKGIKLSNRIMNMLIQQNGLKSSVPKDRLQKVLEQLLLVLKER